MNYDKKAETVAEEYRLDQAIENHVEKITSCCGTSDIFLEAEKAFRAGYVYCLEHVVSKKRRKMNSQEIKLELIRLINDIEGCQVYRHETILVRLTVIVNLIKAEEKE